MVKINFDIANKNGYNYTQNDIQLLYNTFLLYTANYENASVFTKNNLKNIDWIGVRHDDEGNHR